MSSSLERLVEDLPDEDLCEDPQEAIDLYRSGSKPRCEEAEYLEMLRDALKQPDPSPHRRRRPAGPRRLTAAGGRVPAARPPVPAAGRSGLLAGGWCRIRRLTAARLLGGGRSR